MVEKNRKSATKRQDGHHFPPTMRKSAEYHFTIRKRDRGTPEEIGRRANSRGRCASATALIRLRRESKGPNNVRRRRARTALRGEPRRSVIPSVHRYR